MLKSTGVRFVILGVLTVLMVIPLFFVGVVIDNRANYSRQAIDSVGRDMGGAQILGAPVLFVPVQGPVDQIQRQEVFDDATGQIVFETVKVTEIAAKDPIQIAPKTFDASVYAASELRKRGIFKVPVFRAEAEVAFDFDLSSVENTLLLGEKILWDQAYLEIPISDNRALRGEASLTVDGDAILLFPRETRSGIAAALGDPREMDRFDLKLGFTGAKSLSLVPAGRETNVEMRSDWPHPSFQGRFLPDAYETSDEGFSAEWTIPHLARNLPQVSRNNFEGAANGFAFGVSFFQPNDFYQKAYRAATYGILFIALTFLTVFLTEARDRAPTHPVQYILIGLAQSIFVLLMVAYAEQIGFTAAYILSSIATIGAITMLAVVGLKLGNRSFVVGGLLVVLYAILYLILKSNDFALLAGATLAFLALVGTIWATRNEDWYGASERLMAKTKPKPEAK